MTRSLVAGVSGEGRVPAQATRPGHSWCEQRGAQQGGLALQHGSAIGRLVEFNTHTTIYVHDSLALLLCCALAPGARKLRSTPSSIVDCRALLYNGTIRSLCCPSRHGEQKQRRAAQGAVAERSMARQVDVSAAPRRCGRNWRGWPAPLQGSSGGGGAAHDQLLPLFLFC